MFHSINTRVAVAFLVAAVIVVVAFGGFGFFYIITNQDEVIFKTRASAADSCATVFELASEVSYRRAGNRNILALGL